MTSIIVCLFFFFKQKTAYEMRISDWSSDVCSSDLLHAALGGGHQGHPAGRPVDEHAEVELARDVAAFLDVEALDLLAGRAGLLGHQHVAQHRTGVGLHLLDRLHDAHAALAVGVVLETPGAAPAGVDLRFHDPYRAAQLARCALGLFGDRKSTRLNSS